MSNYKQGMRRTKLYGIWTAMLARCNNPNSAAYSSYGARGIKVCESWHQFTNFQADMGAPKPGQSLDRIDNDQGYSKENCCWATRSQQNRNKRTNRVITVDGESKTMAEWAEISGLKLTTIWARIAKGWDEKAAVSVPAIKSRAGLKPSEKLYLQLGAQHGVTWDAPARRAGEVA